MIRRIWLLAALGGTAIAGYDAGSVAGEWLINSYKTIISPLQGTDICNFWPTCSQYTRGAIRRYGLLPGMVMGADRLTRCNTFAWTYFGAYYDRGIDHNRIVNPVVPGNSTPVAALTASQGTAAPQTSLVGASAGNFADYLFENRHYAEAAIEFERLRFEARQPGLKTYAELMAAESYLALNDTASASSAFSAAERTAPDFGRYGTARVLLRQGEYGRASQMAESVTTAGLLTQARVVSGWALLKERRFEQAAATFARLPDSLGATLALMDGRGIRRRSRALSTALSVVPGLGQAYSGRLGDGVYSLLTVASTGLVTYWFAADPARRDRTRVKVSIFGFLTALFYAGNLYGANVAARDYNLLQERRYIESAESELGNVRLVPDYATLLADSVAAETTGLTGR